MKHLCWNDYNFLSSEYVPGSALVLQEPYISRVHTKVIENGCETLFVGRNSHDTHRIYMHPIREKEIKRTSAKNPCWGGECMWTQGGGYGPTKRRLHHVQCATGTLHTYSHCTYIFGIYGCLSGVWCGEIWLFDKTPLSLYCSTSITL